MRYTVILILVFMRLTMNVFARAIPARPLRKLVMESEYIIVGNVIKTDTLIGERGFYIYMAKIAIIEALQGNINKDTLEIEFHPNLFCPEGDRYIEKTHVLSFFDKNKESDKFYTHALSYGVKTLKKEEIEIYKQRISEIQQILKIPDIEKQRTETVEWLVECAENETTQWEGTFELYDQNFRSAISIEQKERLKKVLFNNNEFVDFKLVNILYKENKTQIDSLLLNRLKTLKEDYYWAADYFFEILKHKNTSKKMKNILEEYEKYRTTDDKKEKLKTVIDEFIQLVEQ